MAHEKNRNGKYYCSRLGAACDFRIIGLESDPLRITQSARLVKWILEQRLPFNSLYYYGGDRPVHISYGLQQKRKIWAFTAEGVPTKKGIEQWLERVNPRF